MKRSSCFWCWWLHRYLWFKKYEDNLSGRFEDATGIEFILTPAEMKKLEAKEV